MPGAVIVANQTGGAGAGTPGVAREDLWQDTAVELLVGTGGNTTYLWELTDIPPGSAANLSSSTSATSGFSPDLVGTYRVRLTVNGGGPGNVQVLVFRVRFDSAGALSENGWAMPAFQETPAEANYNGNMRGWAQVLERIISDIRTALENGGGGGGGGPALDALQEQVDALSDVVGGNTENISAAVAAVTALSTSTNTAVSSRVVELSFVSDIRTDPIGTWTRAGARSVDLSMYPTTLGGKTRRVRIFAVLENGGSGITFAAEARLYDLTHAVVVTSSALTNTAQGNRNIPADLSATVTVGTTNGTLRSEAPALYELQFRANGTLAPPDDQAIVSSARLEISYV